MRSYRPEELFDDDGLLRGIWPPSRRRATTHEREPTHERRRFVARPAPTGLPRYAVDVPEPGHTTSEAAESQVRTCATSSG